MRDVDVGLVVMRFGLLLLVASALLTAVACSLLAPTDEDLFGEGGRGSGGATARSSSTR